MLGFLRIRDFALIEGLELELGPGLTVLSGETGAGKSIILSALGLLLGQRAAADLIRQGKESAVVEALFHLRAGSALDARLEKEGLIQPEAPGELVVRRVVSQKGRNRVEAGGGLSTLAVLAALVPEMVNLCGQHAHQKLLKPDEHLLFLDAYAGLEAGREELGRAVAQVRELGREISRLQKTLAERERRREELEHTVAELKAAQLDPEEEEQLKKERRLLANSEKVAQLTAGALQGLYEAEEVTAVDLLSQALGLLQELADLDESVQPLADRVEESFYQLKDAARDLAAYQAGLSFDPGRRDWVEARLLEIRRLVRKHGADVPAALVGLARAEAELAELDTSGERIAELEQERRKAVEQALGMARELSRQRTEAGPRLARAVEKELAQLGMAACRFEVRFTPPQGPAVETKEGPLSGRGLEEATFFIAPNPGEGFMPLDRIASGGELSRILLALEGLVGRRRGASTLIFDEVDAGIGGAVGSAVGRKLAALAKDSQVICITHLPQIAAWADDHLVVRKQTAQGRTATEVAPLAGDGERVAEIARMLAGLEDESTTVEHARQMLSAAREEKRG